MINNFQTYLPKAKAKIKINNLLIKIIKILFVVYYYILKLR